MFTRAWSTLLCTRCRRGLFTNLTIVVCLGLLTNGGAVAVVAKWGVVVVAAGMPESVLADADAVADVVVAAGVAAAATVSVVAISSCVSSESAT